MVATNEPTAHSINYKLLQNTTPQWKNRRKVVKYSLLTFGTVFVIIALCGTFSLVWATLHPDHVINVPKSVSSILINVLWVIGIAYMAIVGSYVFGAQWDITSFRKYMGSSIIDKFNGGGSPPPNQGE